MTDDRLKPGRQKRVELLPSAEQRNLSFVICHLSFERASGELRYRAATATYFAAIFGRVAISSAFRDRTTLPGEPITSEPAGILVSLVTNVWAPIIESEPTSAPSRTKAPMPINTRSLIRQA